MKTCPHCKESFVFEKPKQFGSHIVNCKSNPKQKERRENLSKSLKGKTKPKKHCDKCDGQISNSNFDRHYLKCNPNKRKPIKVDEIWAVGEDKYKCPFCEFISIKTGIGSHIFLEHTSEGADFKKNKYVAGMNGKMGWSKGLTKETDIRVRKAAQQIKEMIASGKIIPHQLGKPLTNDHKEKLSLAQSKVLEEKEISNSYVYVKYYKQKNIIGKEYSLRGTYELKLAQWLNDKNILWNRDKLIHYLKDDVKKSYTPDFYLPEYDLYLETKGYYPEKDQNKMKLVLEQNRINLKMIFQETIKNLDNILLIEDLF